MTREPRPALPAVRPHNYQLISLNGRPTARKKGVYTEPPQRAGGVGSNVHDVAADRVSLPFSLLTFNRGLLVSGLCVLTVTGSVRTWQFSAIAAAFGLADAFFWPASAASCRCWWTRATCRLPTP